MGKNFGSMPFFISQHINNKLLMQSIVKYFERPSMICKGRARDLQITLSGIKLWENVLFKHFNKFTIHVTKKLSFEKLIIIRELLFNNNNLKQVSKFRKWKVD